MAEWTNSDGLVVRFDNPSAIGKAARVRTAGAEKELVVEWDFENLPTPASNDFRAARLPAGSVLLDAHLIVGTAFAGGTSYNIGFAQADGTAIDADGIDSGVLLAALTAGAYIDCDGADINTVVDTANDAYVVVAATGTFTAGTAKLVLKYV